MSSASSRGTGRDMKILVAGASGFLGSRLRSSLIAGGHRVIQLVRRDPDGPNEVRWDPDSGVLDTAALDGADAVINLCGVGVGDKRWSDAYKREIVESRVRPSRLLAQACVDRGVPVLLNASAIGFYGHRGDENLNEQSESGDDFMARVCVDWEAATAVATNGGTRTVHLRTGLVLGHEGGLLPKLSLVTKLFAGGRLGSGRQWYSWISVTDEIAAMVFLLDHDVSGPVNLTAPNPVRNADFVHAIGRTLHRPTPWVVPEFALRLVLGEFAAEVVHGQKVRPTALLDAGFRFAHPTLVEALAAETP